MSETRVSARIAGVVGTQLRLPGLAALRGASFHAAKSRGLIYHRQLRRIARRVPPNAKRPIVEGSGTSLLGRSALVTVIW